MVHAISRYLTDFRLDTVHDVPPPDEIHPLNLLSEVPADDMAEQLQAIKDRTKQEEQARARKELEVALEAERIRSDERLAAERMKWVQDQAAELASQLATALQQIEAKLVSSAARIITPFLTESLRRQVIDDLEMTLRTLLSDKSQKIMRISGPNDILTALAEKLGSNSPAIEFIATNEPDVCVVAKDTVIETQLAAWTTRLTNAAQSS